jgi:hypothetical protein
MNEEMLVTGIVLILATVAFAVGASAPDYSRLNRRVWSVPEEEVGADPRAWRWANYAFLASAFLTLVGLGFLSLFLYHAGSLLLAPAGFLLFSLGIVFWVAYLAFRLSIMLWAGKIFLESSEVPALYQPLSSWSNAMGTIYMLLGYLTMLISGGAILQTGFLASWLGLTSVLFGLAGTIAILTGQPRWPGTEASIAYIPFWIQVMPLMFGIALVVK